MENKFEIFKELFETSQNEKRGLTIYINGQTVAGIVTKIIGTEAVEVRNQMFNRIILIVDEIDGIAVS
jgi:hypothetical protein